MRMPQFVYSRWFLLGVFLVLAAIPLVTNRYTQFIVNLCFVYAVAGIGLNFLLGFAGQFAFAHAALMGIGAYATALLCYRLGVSFWIALPVSGLLAALIGAIATLPALRMKRVYLALMTLAFAELIQWALIHWKALTFGTDGVSVPAPRLFGYAISGDYAVFYVILVVTYLMVALARRILQSRIGRSFVAVRGSEIVSLCNGISIAETKAIVFTLSAFYAGISGSLFAITLGYLVPDGFGLFHLVVHFSIVVIGGLGSMMGAIVGSVLLTALPEVLRGLQALQEIIYGVLLMVFIVFMPTGVVGLLKKAGILPREVLVRDWQAAYRRFKAGNGKSAGPERSADDGEYD